MASEAVDAVRSATPQGFTFANRLSIQILRVTSKKKWVLENLKRSIQLQVSSELSELQNEGNDADGQVGPAEAGATIKRRKPVDRRA